MAEHEVLGLVDALSAVLIQSAKVRQGTRKGSAARYQADILLGMVSELFAKTVDRSGRYPTVLDVSKVQDWALGEAK